MRRLLLHVGMDKTGTTATQAFLALHRDRHVEKGVLYPLTGRYPNDLNHLAFFACATESKVAIPTPLPKPPMDYPDYLDALQREIEETRPHTVILSHESLWLPNAFPPHTLQRIVQDILQDRSSAHAEVVTFLRESDSYALSSYAQSAAGPQRSFSSFAHHLNELVERGVVLYDRRLTEFRNIVGAQNVHARLYSPGRTVTEVLKLAGLPSEAASTKTNVQNSRASWTGVQMHRAANKLRVPQRIKRRTIQPLDHAVQWAVMRFDFVRKLDAQLQPIKTAELAAFRAKFPLPACLYDVLHDNRALICNVNELTPSAGVLAVSKGRGQ